MTEIIDETDRVPKLRNRRVTIFDVMLTMRVNPNPEQQFEEAWRLSDEQIRDVREYVEENKEELKGLEEEIVEESEAGE